MDSGAAEAGTAAVKAGACSPLVKIVVGVVVGVVVAGAAVGLGVGLTVGNSGSDVKSNVNAIRTTATTNGVTQVTPVSTEAPVTRQTQGQASGETTTTSGDAEETGQTTQKYTGTSTQNTQTTQAGSDNTQQDGQTTQKYTGTSTQNTQTTHAGSNNTMQTTKSSSDNTTQNTQTTDQTAQGRQTTKSNSDNTTQNTQTGAGKTTQDRQTTSSSSDNTTQTTLSSSDNATVISQTTQSSSDIATQKKTAITTADPGTRATGATTAFSDIPSTTPTTVLQTTTPNVTCETGFERTIIMVKFATTDDNNLFFRGGANDRIFMTLQYPSQPLGSSSAFDKYYYWTGGDTQLDWNGGETTQRRYNGSEDALGSPAARTNNVVGDSAYYYLNDLGADYWVTDTCMRCSDSADGWFEMKSYTKNEAWDADRSQGSVCGGSADPTDRSQPRSTGNHMGRCGKMNIFERGQNTCTINNIL